MPTPLKYNPAYHDDWAWSLAIKGATDQDIADVFHVSRRTIIRWRQTYPSFNEACQHGKEVADAKVKRSLYERAVGFEYQEKESVIDVDPRTDRSRCGSERSPRKPSPIRWRRCTGSTTDAGMSSPRHRRLRLTELFRHPRSIT